MGSRVTTGLGVATLVAAAVAGGRLMWTGSSGDAEPAAEPALAQQSGGSPGQQPDGTGALHLGASQPSDSVDAQQSGEPQAQPMVAQGSTSGAQPSKETGAQDGMPGAAPEDVLVPEDTRESSAQPGAVASGTRDAVAQSAPAKGGAAQSEPVLVQIDVLRLEADGAGVIAGQVFPLRNLFLRLQGEELTKVAPDAQGRFVAFVTIPPSDEARRLFVVAEGSEDAAAWVMIAPRGVADTGSPEASDPGTEGSDQSAEGSDLGVEGSDQGVEDPDPGARSPALVVGPSAEQAETRSLSEFASVESGSDSGAGGAQIAQDLTEEAPPATAKLRPEAGDSPSRSTASGGRPWAVEGGKPGSSETDRRPSEADEELVADPVLPSVAPTTVQTAPAVPETLVASVSDRPKPRSEQSDPQPQPETPQALLVSDQGGVRLLSQAPNAPEGVSLSVISYSADGIVRLSGTSGEGVEMLRLYVDNRPLQETPARPEGQWQTDLPEIDPGNYTLRVDGVTADGTVLAQVESPFRREDPAAVAAVLNDEQVPVRGDITRHIVQPGNSLWLIAEQTYGDGVYYVQLYRANRDLIRNPDLIYPGQVFRLPDLD